MNRNPTEAPRLNTPPNDPNGGAMSAIAHRHRRVDVSPPAASSKMVADTSIHQKESSSPKSSSLEKDTTKCASRPQSISASSLESTASVISKIGELLSATSTKKDDEEASSTPNDDQEQFLGTENDPSSSFPPFAHANEMLPSSSSSSLSSSGAGATSAAAATILAPRKRELHYFSDQYRGWLNLLLDDISDSETEDDEDDAADDEMDIEQEQQQQQQEEEVNASVEFTGPLQHQPRRGSYRLSHEEGAMAVAANIVASMMDEDGDDFDDDEHEAPTLLPQ